MALRLPLAVLLSGLGQKREQNSNYSSDERSEWGQGFFLAV